MGWQLTEFALMSVFISTQPSSQGRRVTLSGLRNGRLVEPSGWSDLLAFTEVLTDSVETALRTSNEIDEDCQFGVVNTPGATSTELKLRVRGEGFEADVRRHLVRGLFPLNPLAPEFASNYNVDVEVRTADDVEDEAIKAWVKVFLQRAEKRGIEIMSVV